MASMRGPWLCTPLRSALKVSGPFRYKAKQKCNQGPAEFEAEAAQPKARNLPRSCDPHFGVVAPSQTLRHIPASTETWDEKRTPKN